MKISRMITLRRLAAGDDTEELLPEDGGGLGVKFRLHQCCCGSKKRLLIILLVSLLVVGAVATLTYFLTKSHRSSTSTPSTPPSPPTPPTPHGKICNTTSCFNISQGHPSSTSTPSTPPSPSEPPTPSTPPSPSTPPTPPSLSKSSTPPTPPSLSKPSTPPSLSKTSTPPSSKPSTPPLLSMPPTPHGKICNTTRCFNISKDISSQLDKGVNPCTDFYSYTCGGFFKRHHLGVNQSKETAMTILSDDNMKVLQDTLQNANSNYSQNSAFSKTTKIYNSCLDTTGINNRGTKPLEDLIEQYGGWSVTGRGLNSWSVAQKMGRIVRDLNVQTLLSVSVITDFEDSSKHILRIGPSTLGMSQNYYENTKIRQAYKTYMKTIARLLGGGSYSEQKMMNVYNFEEYLAGATVGKSYTDDVVESLRQYHRSGRSLDSLDGTIFDFCLKSNFRRSFILSFLNTAFSYQGIYFTYLEKVFYGYASIFKDIATKYRYTSDTTVKDYIMWRVVDHFVMSMPRQFVEAKLKFTEAVAGAQKYERWSYCIEKMMTPMDMTLGRLFVDEHFDEATKQTVADMTTRLRKAFINNLYSANWMDYETREAAKEKANAIKEDVGYPLYIKDDSKLDAHYSMLAVSGEYFENTVAMNKMLIQRHLGVLRQPVNKDLWNLSPAQINGYYSPQQNRIVFLAGILQSPFYKKNYPKYINYGSLAMIIGHEITHGFDGTGRLFDKNGNVRDWWSSHSAENFKTRSNCLVDQYNHYEVFGKYIDGKQTLNENIADNGGIKLTYEAYQSWVRDNGQEGRFSGLSLDVDQLFFIGFAQPWCSVYKKEAALYQLKTDVHSYNKYRVIGPLSNFDKFSKAFRCPTGSKMNPYRKCSVW